MKINKLILSVGLFAVALSSCTDLDVTPDSQYTTDPSKNSGVDEMLAVEAKMADVYFHLAGTLGRRYMEAQCLASDEFTGLAFDGGYYDAGTYAHTAYHTSIPTDASIDWYSDVVAGITKANTVLEDLGSSASAKMKAPARAMRAYYTWILMDSYGKAPILTSVPAEGEVPTLYERNKVAQWLSSELQDIYPNLTDSLTTNNYGKPTRYMAEALLAKIYINWPVYNLEKVADYDASKYTNDKLDSCIILCNDIISAKDKNGKAKFNIGTVDYLHKFSYDNGQFVGDFIYAIPYDAIDRQGMQYARPRSFKDMKNLVPNTYGDPDKFTQSFGGNIVVTPEFQKLFCLTNDIRNYCILRGDVYVRDPNTLLPTSTRFQYKGADVSFTTDITLVKDDGTIDVGNDPTAYQQGCHSIKWFTRAVDYNNGRNQSNDLPIFRYADILLMKAEALTRGGKDSNPSGVAGCDDALSLFNQIRTYAGAPTFTGQTLTLEDIYEERGREFFDENWRRNDMIRFGHYEDEFFPHYKKSDYASFEPAHRVFPIPQSMLDLNPGWTQNDKY